MPRDFSKIKKKSGKTGHYQKLGLLRFHQTGHVQKIGTFTETDDLVRNSDYESRMNKCNFRRQKCSEYKIPSKPKICSKDHC